MPDAPSQQDAYVIDQRVGLTQATGGVGVGLWEEAYSRNSQSPVSNPSRRLSFFPLPPAVVNGGMPPLLGPQDTGAPGDDVHIFRQDVYHNHAIFPIPCGRSVGLRGLWQGRVVAVGAPTLTRHHSGPARRLCGVVCVYRLRTLPLVSELWRQTHRSLVGGFPTPYSSDLLAQAANVVRTAAAVAYPSGGRLSAYHSLSIPTDCSSDLSNIPIQQDWCRRVVYLVPPYSPPHTAHILHPRVSYR